MLYPQKAPAISYAERPRLERAMQCLTSKQRVALVALFNQHLADRNIQSLQRRGQFCYITVTEEKGEAVGIYDFGQAPAAQNFLVALADCLGPGHRRVRVLRPEPPPANP